MPHEPGLPEQEGSDAPPAVLEAKTESFFSSRVEPQCGQGVPSHLLDRTSTSLSFPHFPQ
jgi:hypothetical protein